MPIKVTCECGRVTNVPDAYAGRTGKCPACKRPVKVPLLAPVAAPEPVAVAVVHEEVAVAHAPAAEPAPMPVADPEPAVHDEPAPQASRFEEAEPISHHENGRHVEEVEPELPPPVVEEYQPEPEPELEPEPEAEAEPRLDAEYDLDNEPKLEPHPDLAGDTATEIEVHPVSEEEPALDEAALFEPALAEDAGYDLSESTPPASLQHAAPGQAGGDIIARPPSGEVQIPSSVQNKRRSWWKRLLGK